MGEPSILAQQRLSMLDLYYQLKNVSLVCRVFKVSRKTFYKWKKRFEESGKKLSFLENQSRAPKRKREKQLTWEQEVRIKRLRKQHLTLGKAKLQIIYQKRYKQYISQHHIQYVIEKYNLYPDPNQAKRVRTKRIKNRGKRKTRIFEVNPLSLITKDKPFFFCLDTIVLYLPWGVKRYILTAIDYQKKLGFAYCYSSPSSLSAFDFLLRLLALTEGRISAVLTDNGSEWEKYFEAACHKLKIKHIFTRVKTPKDNSINERFNGTIKKEFLNQSETFEYYLAENNIQKANKELIKYLIFYNFERPHQALNYQTPMGYTNKVLQSLGVLPMYPSRTQTCKKKKNLLTLKSHAKAT